MSAGSMIDSEPRPVVARPTGWWAMLWGDAAEYSRKSVTDRRTGSSTTIEDQVRRTAVWCVPDAAATAGAGIFRQPGVMVSNGAAAPAGAAGPPDLPVLVDLEFDDDRTDGTLRPGGPKSDRMPSAPRWTLEFEVMIDGRGSLIVATGYGLEQPPLRWSSLGWAELEANRRLWLDSLR